MATKADVRRLTLAFKTSQNRRAAILAALTASYYRRQVDFNDPSTIDRWLEIFAPRILREHGIAAREAAAFVKEVRKAELPDVAAVAYEPVTSINLEQVRTSLAVVGPGAVRSKAYALRADREASPVERQAALQDAMNSSVTAVTGAVSRHVQNGGRQTIYDGQKADVRARGYIRVTKDEPCYFCAMLASRGPVFDEDSFASSDPRFTGGGDVKVHDSCGCAVKPVFRIEEDPYIDASREFERQWREFSGAGDADALTNFRRGYEGRALNLRVSS